MSEVTRKQHRVVPSDFSIVRILANDRADTSVCPRDENPRKLDQDDSTTVTAECPVVSESTLLFGHSKDPRLQLGSSANRKIKLPWVPPQRDESKYENDVRSAAAGTVQLADYEQRRIQSNELAWLSCTRYKPPRLPRKSSVGKSAKRRPGAHPRIPFSALQLKVLEDKYGKGAYLSRRDVVQLSAMLRLPQSRVKIWFQNRRARERRELRTCDDSSSAERRDPESRDIGTSRIFSSRLYDQRLCRSSESNYTFSACSHSYPFHCNIGQVVRKLAVNNVKYRR